MGVAGTPITCPLPFELYAVGPLAWAVFIVIPIRGIIDAAHAFVCFIGPNTALARAAGVAVGVAGGASPTVFGGYAYQAGPNVVSAVLVVGTGAALAGGRIAHCRIQPIGA